MVVKGAVGVRVGQVGVGWGRGQHGIGDRRGGSRLHFLLCSHVCLSTCGVQLCRQIYTASISHSTSVRNFVGSRND